MTLKFNALLRAILAGGSAPLPEFDYLVVVGSSTTDQTYAVNPSLGRQEQATRQAFTTEFGDIPVISKAMGGATIAALDAGIAGYLADPALDGKRVAVVINIGSNDITQTSYSSMAQGTKDAMAAGITSIVSKVVAAGMTPMLGNSNSRKTYEAMYEEWAALFYAPLVDALTPAFKIGGETAFDYSGHYFTNKDVTNWWNADNVHPWMATVPNQVYTAQQLKKVAKCPAMPAKESFIFKYDNGSGENSGGLNRITGAGTQTLATVVNNRGATVSGVSYGYTGAGGTGNTVRAGVGNYGVGLSHVGAQSWYLYTSGGNNVHTSTGGATYANRTGTAKFTFNTSNAARVSRFTIGASSADITGNAAGLQTASVPFTADASGVVVVTVSPASGTYASVSGMQFEFD